MQITANRILFDHVVGAREQPRWRPSALAVFTLTAKSNLVGRSVGLARARGEALNDSRAALLNAPQGFTHARSVELYKNEIQLLRTILANCVTLS
jgi:hypothetical protein